MSLDVTSILNIIQALFSATVESPIYPWSISSSVEALEESWYVQIKLPLDRDPAQVFTELYWLLEANIQREIYPGLVVFEPRLVAALQLDLPGLPTHKQKFFFSLGLKLTGNGAHQIWNGLSQLETENPFTIRECHTRSKFVYAQLRKHRLLGFTDRVVFKVRSVEVVLLSGPLHFRVLVTRPHDQHCKQALPLRLEDYDLAPNIRLVSLKLLRSRYHSAITDLICYWTLTYRLSND